MYALNDRENALSLSLDDIRLNLRKNIHADEEKCIDNLLHATELTFGERNRLVDRARDFVTKSRDKSDSQGTMDYFLQEFDLSNKEGVALMCLAESLLRVPDGATADKLINEKIKAGKWSDHKGHSESTFVNASTWGLMLTGEFVDLGDVAGNTDNWFKSFIKKAGEPVVRTAIMQAMRIMGGQYVLGRTIEEAISRGIKENKPGTRFSFDMLGEGARTMADADRYFEAYKTAILEIGKGEKETHPYPANGISVKFSALHPRYEMGHHDVVMSFMAPRIIELAKLAKERNLGFTIDAEEADRLDISLDIFEAMARSEELQDWEGLGLVVQAYQKRAPYVIDWLTKLGRELNRKFMVRLVKGAYWDSEIKHAQEAGLSDYPVYTRKPSTDLSYQVCAERLMSARDVFYPQFATHNAYSVALILELVKKWNVAAEEFEFQRLHGMGHLLYDTVSDNTDVDFNIRVYAPVGAHKDLLPYLVRRLLENGANSSFVNRFMDSEVAVDDLMQDTIKLVEEKSPKRHSMIPLPADILSASEREAIGRKNASGFELTDPLEIEELSENLKIEHDWTVGPIVSGEMSLSNLEDVLSPTTGHAVGKVGIASDDDIERALSASTKAQKAWNAIGGAARAKILNEAANELEARTHYFMGLVAKEAGRTLADGLSEVREAVDFLRYYAGQAEEKFEGGILLPGPTGERNELYLNGRGTFLCISPWNFPLAIFLGQVTAALAAGNAVIAKPAEQTPIVAAEAVKIMHEAGVPVDVLHLMTGDGATVGAKLVADERISGVAFTGSTETAKIINRSLANREGAIVPLIAETGGQNVMIVDSTALPEQVVDDAISSAFQSAGQRCSALRVLYIQDDVADTIIPMLKGAMDCLSLGNPLSLKTDVGPVIDGDARGLLDAHIERMDREATLLHKLETPDEYKDGTFFGPCLYEIGSLDQLTNEVFGPVLHVIRYKASKLDDILAQVQNTGFGLTLGVHSRIEESANYIFRNLDVGNTYVNRNIVGAVVGVQPFGGQGLSGTGPKAGGPRYLYRFATEKTLTINTVATGGNTELFAMEEE
ncbi:bifunctional proline dehydrogenase/L-glutamate gamma-semialdehyde dehydrogenase PutA [Pseudemcibacter aquimaris]|uniref:bifunctional proline dehydrogenase/L-glutamate gamma-semialdehyde dehydrogenase PutA n=1 Tax=Pseudemcibacter aquimaris TaxID=2857064 RepID=UPI002011C0C4|nr:bifunctional proline dehydrogenase/L-glutamate gamma-semialdehyde dehydrogenase PutA [Pseudemcibacter aquimaris]MCC3862036.1 bifunctional proline dehydrogenase/L-glutamate gamma-semialdehyde dehydrogenase PutA [Pseudemcibacter aquimaris]WDU58788.1 bifunctional proline dehydrogenase/L-glutamate gamma-semialdehyde dehydrogenase PutA [Pseudemcibacter aquimaris]